MLETNINKEPFLEPILRKLRIRKIARYIPKNCKLCDFGCGQKIFLLNTLKSNIRLGVGLDLATNLQTDEKIKLIVCDLEKDIPLQSNTFDAVTSLAVLEHLNNPLQNLKEAYRILKRTGVLILTTPAPISKWLLEFLAHKIGILSVGMISDHKHYFDKKTLKEMLILAGFEEKKMEIKSFQVGLNSLIVAEK